MYTIRKNIFPIIMRIIVFEIVKSSIKTKTTGLINNQILFGILIMLIIKKKLLASIIDLKSEISKVGIVDKPNNLLLALGFLYEID